MANGPYYPLLTWYQKGTLEDPQLLQNWYRREFYVFSIMGFKC